MSSQNVLIGLLVILVIAMCVMAVRDSDYFNLKCILSSVDGNTYCVRDRKLSQEAADLLASTVQKCNKLVEHLKNKDPDSTITKRLAKKYNPKKVKETLPTSKHTTQRKKGPAHDVRQHENDNLIIQTPLCLWRYTALAHCQ